MSSDSSCYFCGGVLADVTPVGPKRVIWLRLELRSGTQVTACIDCVGLEHPDVVDRFETDEHRALRAEMHSIMGR